MWLDCSNNNSVVPNETGQTFTASKPGSYSVEISKNGCIDTSACLIISTVSISKNEILNQVIIYPNPNTGQFTIEKSSDLNKEIQIRLLDATSKLIIENNIPRDKQKIEVDIRKYSKGIYYLHLVVDDEQFVKQLLKKIN